MFLDFDNWYVKFFLEWLFVVDEVEVVFKNYGIDDVENDNEFIKIFKEMCEFVSGYGYYYEGNELNWILE